MDSRTKKLLIILSPLVVIGVGRLVALLFTPVCGKWVWIPMMAVVWAMFALFVAWGAGLQDIKRWLGKSKGSWGWPVLAVIVGILPLQVFVLNWNRFPSTWAVVAWLIFGLINPFLEEFYWRGLILDKTSNWPGWLAVLFSSFFFAINHPLTVGVYSIANRHPVVLVSTFIMGVAWAVVYLKTKSLRWPVFAHMLTDLLNLSILAFLNIVLPPPVH